jgi:hypothetical protein
MMLARLGLAAVSSQSPYGLEVTPTAPIYQWSAAPGEVGSPAAIAPSQPDQVVEAYSIAWMRPAGPIGR